MANDERALIEINSLKVIFPLDEGTVRAVEDVDLVIKRGQVMGVVGESGCGKTVTAQSIMRIVPDPGRIEHGEILFHRRSPDGTKKEIIDIAKMDPRGSEIRSYRGKEVAMIFQEPLSSFSPLHTIGNQIMEAILLHQDVNKKQAREIAKEMLARVRIPNPTRRLDQYPHEFSGGMRQRAMIAMALTCKPALLMAEEPTTALDVTIQAQILDLMKELQEEFGMAIMFITHNLGVIAQIAEAVAIMYLGKIVEIGPSREIFHNPQHPYTFNLLKAIPRIGKTTGQHLVAIEGAVPGPFERPSGCTFYPRCERIIPNRCDMHNPGVTRVGEGHAVRCFLYSEDTDED
ncbi:MAG: dipeptide/oligopeptide/nickel ABC transporter ATP-binding protein [Chloroflexi bacterium RBG_16_48_8]|nr:MAG: dipeptide/oligopeptide/nickel ABC transporter ATP-binding protein [Chloroflexi bacterium RBG_16_48_8]